MLLLRRLATEMSSPIRTSDRRPRRYASRMRSVPILIAGGGPVGLTLARCLAVRGIRCMLVERNATTTAHPKMDMTNTRTMELFRNLGLADQLRAVGVPVDHPLDV